VSPPKGRRRVLLAIPAIAYASVILFLSSRPGADVPSLGIPFGDKFLHVVEYFLLGLLVLLPVSDAGWRHRLLAIALGIALAAIDESFQTTVPGRLGDVADFIVDVGGLLAAVVFDATVRPWRFTARPS